ncbi:MAG: tetratricopeptide repeat protein, partial [Chloroflexi bacterium]|nr:tetratricopeptide repeat protein [Chloroflexota bacterium]
LALQAQKDYDGARAAFERALAIDETIFGPDHPNVAVRANNLGRTLQAQGEYEAARATYERALFIFEQKLGPDHPHTQLVCQNLNRLQTRKRSFGGFFKKG